MATRTMTVMHRPGRKLKNIFNGSTSPLFNGDPNAASPALNLTSATGLSGVDGLVTVELGAGFKPPVVLTAWYWSDPDQLWKRLGGNSSVYQKSFDATNTSDTFAIGERIPFLITTNAWITGNVYVDSDAHVLSTN